MKKLLCIFLLLCAAAFGQTTISDTLHRPNSSLVNGSVTISWSDFTTSTALSVSGGSKTVSIVNGSFTTTLQPNQGASPSGTFYKATFVTSDGYESTEFWVVPTSGPATLAAIRSSSAPAVMPPAGSGSGSSGNATSIQGTPVVSTPPTDGQAIIFSSGSYRPTAIPSASGSVLKAPTTDQPVIQPLGTTLSANSLQKVIYVTPSFNWSQATQPGDDLSVSGAQAIHLLPCPLGVNGTNTDHYVYISTTGTAESPKITGGTCTSGAASGTLTFTTINAHSSGYTVGSATAGFKEASEYAKFAPTSPTGSLQGGVVMGLPGVEYDFRAPFYIESATQTVDFNGSIIQCYSTSSCIHMGDDSNSNDYAYVVIKGVRLRAMAAGVGGIIDNSQGGKILNGPKTRNSATSSYFSFLVSNVNNQAEELTGVDPSTGSNWGQCTTEPCSVVLKGGSSSGITYMHDSNLTINCLGNGVDWNNANTLSIRDSVIQGYNQWGIKANSGFSVNPAGTSDNVYEEVAGCVNPLGTGTAGIIVQGGRWESKGQVGPVGKYPTIAASVSGTTQFWYYIVPKSSTLGTGAALLLGRCLSNGTGTCLLKWYKIGSTGTITYDVIRIVGDGSQTGPYTTSCVGGSVSACGSVALAQAQGTVCTGNVCTITDDITANTTSYTVSNAAYSPKIDEWSTDLVLSPTSDTSNINLGATEYFTDFWGGGNQSVASTSGGNSYSVIAQQCYGGPVTGAALLSCQSGDATLASMPSEVKLYGPLSTVGSLKGLIDFSPGNLGSLGSTDLLTVWDSNHQKLAANNTLRGSSDASDLAIGLSNASSLTPANSRMGLRAAIGIDQYVNHIFDGTSWLERLDATTKTFKVPVIAHGLTIDTLTGSTQCLHVSTTGVVTGTGADCGSGGSVGPGTANSIVKFATTTTVGDAAASDIVAEFTGTPDGTKFLRDDGTLVVPTGSGDITNVTVAVPAEFSITGSPCTSGACAFTIGYTAGLTANRVLATPDGSSGALSLRALVANDIPASLTSSTSGNSGTATALAANGANCSAGQAPRGVDASGASENCTDYQEEPASNGIVVKTTANTSAARTITGTASQVTVTNGDGVAGNPTISLPDPINVATSGNAATATALAANPTDCSANQYANAIAANGNLTCAQPAYANISGTPTIVYQLTGVAGTSQTARNRNNFIAGAGISITPADNSGSNSTDITIANSGGLTNPMTAQFDIIDGGTSGTPARVPGPTTYDGVPQHLVAQSTGGAASSLGWSPPGVPVAALSSTTPAILYTHRASLIDTTNSTSSTATSIAAAGSAQFDLGLTFVICNTGTVVNTITPTTSTVNGNTTQKLVGQVAGNNPECAFWWSDNSNYFSAEILPTDSNGRLQAAGMPAFTGDMTNTAGALATTVGKVNGGTIPVSASLTGTNGSGQFTAVTTIPTGTVPAFTGDMTNSAGSLATTVGKINGGTFAGTNGHLVGFGSSNVSSDTGIVAANVTVAVSPGAGIAHFGGGTQTETSSAVNLAGGSTEVSGVLPLVNMSQLFVTNAQTATYQVLAADFADCKTIPVASGTFTITLVASGSQPATGQCVDIINYGSGVVTVARSGQNINGAAANLTLAAGSASAPTGVHIVSNGTDYIAQLLGASGTPSFPVTVAGTTTSGGIPYFSSTTVESSSGILNSNILVKGGGAGAAPTNSLITDDGTSATYTGTGGYKAPAFTSTGTTAGFVDFPQGTTSAAVAPCNVATSICEQAPTSVTSYLVTKPGVSASGIRIGTVASAVITEGFSGDSNHSATVTTGSGTSIGSTSLCSTTFCPAGLYRVNVYIDITTACGTTGTYVVNLIYTDDQGSKTVPVNLEGTGSVPATGVLTTTSTANFGYDAFVLRSTGAASINYSTTAVACGTAGPMVGKLYLSVEPLM